MTTTTSQPEYDSPWKEIIELYFPEFMRFFFPQAYAEIDWFRPYTFLDKELQKIIREAETGNRRVDKLVKVFLKDGRETWLLLHIEIQGQRDNDFEERIYIYHYRIFDRYKKEVVSVAILTDDNPNWRPGSYSYGRWGCKASLDFPIIKLLDYNQDELAASDNPFGIVVLAHLRMLATKRKPQERYAAKLTLAKMLYQRGYTRQNILELFRFIDWIMTLPHELAQQFKTELHELEEETHMQYVTSIERLAIEEGREKGLREGIEEGIKEGLKEGLKEGRKEGLRDAIANILTARFGNYLGNITLRLDMVEDTDSLLFLNTQAATVESLAAFTQLLPETSGKNGTANGDG